jgi:hypothetical protein
VFIGANTSACLYLTVWFAKNWNHKAAADDQSIDAGWFLAIISHTTVTACPHFSTQLFTEGAAFFFHATICGAAWQSVFGNQLSRNAVEKME